MAIARCLSMNPEIILFDEPTSTLDSTMASDVLAVIRRTVQGRLFSHQCRYFSGIFRKSRKRELTFCYRGKQINLLEGDDIGVVIIRNNAQSIAFSYENGVNALTLKIDV